MKRNDDKQRSYPYVNNNGSSRESLIRDRLTARSAVLVAIKKLSECHPHGRDYQTAPKGAWEAGQARYAAHFAALDKLYNELGDEAEFLYNDGLEQKR